MFVEKAGMSSSEVAYSPSQTKGLMYEYSTTVVTSATAVYYHRYCKNATGLVCV